MSTRQVYMDFQDGNGFIDVSHLIKYETFRITTRAFNDSYHCAQNELSFEIIYDVSTYAKIRAMTDEIIVRVLDVDAEVELVTESSLNIITESGLNLLVEQSMAVPIFYGRIPLSRSYTYNGILDNTIMQLEAIDEINLLDIPVGDVLYSGCAIANSADPTHSLLHLLAGIAGIDAAHIDSSLSIPATIVRFAPVDPEDTVRNVLDTLLYEYGYTLNMSGASVITPIQWLYSTGYTPAFQFDETNILVEASVQDRTQNYDGAKLTYYTLNHADKVLLYRDDNCGYADNGGFQGYNILAGTTYPPETNVIDDTTGLPTVVYQEYSDASIKYWTNKAIKNNLDYNYKAFSSDFSAMVATEDHFLDSNMSVGLTTPTTEFYNKKCRIVHSNPTLDDGLKLYYNNVYGTVWYKSTELNVIIDNVTPSVKPYKYTTSFVYEKQYADALVKALALQFKVGGTEYSFPSDEYVAIGEMVNIVMGDGTNKVCYVQSRVWEEKTEQYTYTLVSASTDAISLTRNTSSVAVSIDTDYTYGSYTNVGTPAAVSNLVVTVTPKYLGAFLDTAPTTPNTGDWYTRYSATSGTSNRGVFVYDGSTLTWGRTTESKYIGNSAINDILAICAGINYSVAAGYYGTVIDYGATYISDLFSMYIKILTGGAIYGGDRFDSAGTEIDVSKDGFWLGADGTLKANLQSLFRDNVVIGTDAAKGLEDSGFNSSGNTIVGTDAGRGTSGNTYYYNNLFGSVSGFSLSTGYNNCFFGSASGYFTTSGYENCFFGTNAGRGVTTGYNNVFVGSLAGSDVTTASHVICIGYETYAYFGRNYMINIGNRIWSFDFEATETEAVIYDTLVGFLPATTGGGMGGMGSFGIYSVNTIYKSGATTIYVGESGVAVRKTFTKNSATAIGSELHITFMSYANI